MKYILAIDQSTSATKGMLFDETGTIFPHKISLAHRQIYPDGNRIEHDPIEIYQNVLKCIDEMTEYVGVGNIAAVGITNQRETTVIWDKTTGLPIANAVVWQDQRGADICHGIAEYGDEIYQRTIFLCSKSKPFVKACGKRPAESGAGGIAVRYHGQLDNL